MSDAADPYEFDVNQYERPNQKWDCGRSADGMPCPLGPGKNGSCGAVCEPYRDGDRFYCNNASMLSGQCGEGPQADGQCSQSPSQCRPAKRDGRFVCARGQCMQGPFPDGRCSNQFTACQPVRSVLAKRRIFTLSVFSLAIGAALLMVAGPFREPIVSPGPLVSSHATNRCAKCHEAGGGTFPDWVKMAFNPHTDIKQSEKKCLRCHKDLGAHAMHPHSQDPQHLAEITKRIKNDDSYGPEPLFLSSAHALLGKPRPENNQFSCATCHQEHRGRDFDLTKLTNEQCQSCHVKAFHSFESGHPSFTDYPHRRRRRIHFDHGSHYGRHFALANRIMPNGRPPENCATCHVQDETGSKMVVRDFDVSCASCHGAEVTDDLIPGITLFALPAIELGESGSDAPWGPWPDKGTLAEATALADEVPPLMLLLLSSDKGFTDNVEAAGGSLDEMSPSQRDAIVQYTTAIRKLLREIASGDSARLKKRISAALGATEHDVHVPDEIIDDLVRLFSDEGFVGAVQKLQQAVTSKGEEIQPPSTDSKNADGVPDEASEKVRAGQQTSPRPEEDELANGAGGPEDSSATVAADEADGDDQEMLTSDVMRGWVVEKDHSLRYRAERHGDRTLQRMLAIVGRLSGGIPDVDRKESVAGLTLRERATRQLFRQFTDVAAEGRCMKCHTADKSSDGIVFNWERMHPDPSRRPYTDFSHAPHLHLFDDEACGQCHDKKTEWRRYRDEFVHADWSIRTDPHTFSSDFADMSPAKCAQCHQPGRARDNCLTCHNYHVRDAGVFHIPKSGEFPR